MRSIAVCPTCTNEQIAAGQQPRPPVITGELDDNGSIHVQCDKGHIGIVLFNKRRHQVLVQSAARAFLDGYTNEVVAVMSTALERAYEFYIRVSCRAKAIPQKSIADAWRNVASQSERQYGAFQFLYLSDHHVHFQLDPIIPEIRNKVVHKGKIVRETEALNFAEAVYKTINEIEQCMQDKFRAQVKEESEYELKEQETRIPAGTDYLTMESMGAHVDLKENKVTKLVDTFIDHVAVFHQARQRGFPD